jgi:dTDP-4-amino-4,6-dideoxygalactose transaminase
MIPFIELGGPHRQVEAEIRKRLEEVIRSARYILGPAVKEFEEAMARYHGVRHAVGVASGTDALLLALRAEGIGPGDEVITTPFTFVATAEVILHTGAVPVFVDIDGETFNIDPAGVEEKISAKTRALLPVHLYGLPADMAALGEIAGRHGLKVIEDCAQSTGAKIEGRLTGGLAHASGFSFFPTKNLGGFGDGGMVLTDDDTLAAKIGMLRDHGSSERDLYEFLGYNSRLDSIQAAVLEVKLRHLEEWNGQRRANAALYRELLFDVEEIDLPGEPEGLFHVYNQFTITTGRRDELRSYLAEKKIGTMVYYSRALHLQPVFSHLGYGPGDFPSAEKAQSQVLSLPVYPGLEEDAVRTVAGAVRNFFGA